MTELYIASCNEDKRGFEQAEYVAKELGKAGVKCFVPLGKSEEEVAQAFDECSSYLCMLSPKFASNEDLVTQVENVAASSKVLVPFVLNLGWEEVPKNGRRLRVACGKALYWSAAVFEEFSQSPFGEFLKIFLDAASVKDKSAAGPNIKPVIRTNAKPMATPPTEPVRSSDGKYQGSVEIKKRGANSCKTYAGQTMKWQKGKKIGRGAYGEVYKVILLHNGQMAAMKTISTDELNDSQIENIMHEVRILEGCVHTHLISYIGVERDEHQIQMFMELAEGSLRSMIHDMGAFNENLIQVYLKQILQGLHYLHCKGVIHRDVKSDNILIGGTSNGDPFLAKTVMKLADFGCAALHEAKSEKMTSAVGSPQYLAPEVVDPEEPGYDFRADIWSVGCVAVEMVTGEIPWKGLSPFQAIFQTSKGNPPYPSENISAELDDFIQKCFARNPENRPTAEMLLDHPFLTTPYDQLTRQS